MHSHSNQWSFMLYQALALEARLLFGVPGNTSFGSSLALRSWPVDWDGFQLWRPRLRLQDVMRSQRFRLGWHRLAVCEV